MSMRRRLDLLLLLAIVGAAIAAYLSWVALSDTQDVACGPLGDCHTVQSSEFADVAGVPVAFLGLGMYLGLLAMTAARRWMSAGGPRVFTVWSLTVAASGVGYSAYLTYIELFEIDAICIWCVGSALVVVAFFLCCLPDVGALRRPAPDLEAP